MKHMKKNLSVLPALLLCMLSIAGHVHAAGELTRNFERAKQYEPLFQSARAEREANLASSRVSRSALYPELRLNSAREDREDFDPITGRPVIEKTTRTTVTLVQPLVDAGRYASFREGVPREILAEITYQAREQELAVRYMKTVSELVRAREGLLLNQARIDAFGQQAQSAKRAFELGTGTITDLRDAQVRLDQARAADITLRARLSASERQFAAMTGVTPQVNVFNLVRKPAEFSLKGASDYLASAAQDNVQLIAARQNELIGQLGVTRARGAFLPTLNATATHTHTSAASDHYVGLQLNLPLAVGTYHQVSGAKANAQRLAEQTRDVESRTRLEIERLQQLVEAGRMEIAIRLESIKSAELSVEANEKSFRGGVRSKVDVINSIQTLYQTKEEHLNAVLTLAENLLNLHVQIATPLNQAMEQIEQILFDPHLIRSY